MRAKYSAGPSWYRQLEELFDDSRKFAPQPKRLHARGLESLDAMGAADNATKAAGGCNALFALLGRLRNKRTNQERRRTF